MTRLVHSLSAVVGLVALVSAAPAFAQQSVAEQTFVYTTRAGDTCASIARRHFGDSEAHDLIHAHNPGMGPSPHRLVPGTRLTLPNPEAAAEARVLVARRRVERRSPQDPGWRRAHRGDALARGHQVSTRRASSAELGFRDGSRLELRENTLVIVYGGSQRSAARRPRRASLERGALRSRLGELAGAIAVSTPSSDARLGAGEAIVSVDEDGASRVANLRGQASVTAAESTVVLPPGTGSIVRPGRRPSRPRPLPSAPTWANDLAGRSIGLAIGGGTLRGRWEPVPGAARYRVEVARRADGGDVVAAVEVPGSVDSFEVHRLPAGTYYLSVATIDAEFFEGRPSPRRAMQVLAARLVPPGGGTPPPAIYDPGDPSEAWSPPVLLPGSAIVAPAGVRCAAAADVPSGLVTLRRLGRQMVRCVDSRDRAIPAFEVDVALATVRTLRGEQLERGARRDLVLGIDAPLALPPRLVAQAPRGLAVGPVVRSEGGRWHVSVGAGAELPDEVELELMVAVGAERIRVATFRLPVVDGPGLEPPPLPWSPEPAAAYAAAPVGDAFGRVASPSSLGLSDLGAEGVVALGSAAVLVRPGEASQTRLGVAVEAPIFGETLRAGLAFAGDAPGGGAQAHSTLGDSDLRVSATVRFLHAPRADVALSIDTWIPTGVSRRGLGAFRVVPSLEAAVRPHPRLTVRTRQGIARGVQESTTLWASAYGADVALTSSVGLGVEVDGTLGQEGGETLEAWALGAQLVVEHGRLRGTVGARGAVSPASEATLGRWTVAATLGGLFSR